MKEKSDQALKEMAGVFKQRLAEGESLDDLLPEAFAVVREAAWRVLGQRHYDVQLIGGIVLHQGRIAEMKTGEGKTLVSTLPAYLNALTGKGVHLVTVNDYLAKRDSEWMGKIYRFLGLSVGVIVHDMLAEPKSAAQIKNLAENLNLFDFAPGAHSPADYGKYMIQQSGHFEYDENLDAFYDYEKYGTERMNAEDGMFTDRGYIAYKGYYNMEEVMNGSQSSHMEMGGMM